MRGGSRRICCTFQRRFEDALGSLKLDQSQILFIDGIDIRPSSIPFSDYLECVKGLANAVWSVNNDFFSSIRDSKGRLRAVLLIRPDIFDSLGLQNQNTKLRDNAVLLDWRTTYSDYERSELFKLTDRLLAAQQPTSLEPGEAWNYYIPYKITETAGGAESLPGEPDAITKARSSFVSFLRFSFYRPRDIVTMLKILQAEFVLRRRSTNEVFAKADFDHPDFRRKYSDYLLGEIKDHLSFYYSGATYEDFVAFFQYLNGKLRFDYDEYLEAYDSFLKYMTQTRRTPAEFFVKPEIFLQFLFELNVVCWVQKADDEKFIHWSFRERSLSNICPKIKPGERYEIHYGLSKALNTGKRFRPRS
jgi:hypothetical protein